LVSGNALSVGLHRRVLLLCEFWNDRRAFAHEAVRHHVAKESMVLIAFRRLLR
jgi:hypothetical protein